jgi:hypothetical protein
MSASSAEVSAAPAAGSSGGILLALEAGEVEPSDVGASLGAELAARFPGSSAIVLRADGHALGSLVREADRRGARAAVLLRARPREAAHDRLGPLVAPVLDSGFDWVCGAYRRRKLDGMLNTAIVDPLFRALFGRRIRQPCGGEAALSLPLVRALLAPRGPRLEDPGAEASLAAAALSGPWRVAQAWLGPWEGDARPEEDASHALARVVAPVFGEVARSPERWQRIEGSSPVPSFGEAGPLEGARTAGAAELEEAFRLGLRELGGLWGQVLPPATGLALRRAAAAPPGEARLGDALWARIVYDFALAFSLGTIERHQLLRAMTPLYLGWVAGFALDVRELDAEGAEKRSEALGEAFEREKPYAIARWRWPDGFAP